MNNYARFVDKLASNKENRTFFSDGSVQTADVMSAIFKHAANEVWIYNGGFTGPVSSYFPYITALEQFLEKDDVFLHIIVEEFRPQNNKMIYDLLEKHKGEKVELYETTTRLQIDGNFIHFTVGAPYMLRIETNTKDFISETNFNNEVHAKNFINIFNMLKVPDRSKVIWKRTSDVLEHV